MKIVFNIKEDDARNPGVIADCTGDNAGDSVGPSADGFETYGVTGVALISFILVAVAEPTVQVQLLVWIFVMRVVMIVASGVSYLLNDAWAKASFGDAKTMNFEVPLTRLVWLTSIVSVVLTYGMFWFVWAYFGALIAFACLAGPYVLAEITGIMLPIRVRSILVFVAFIGSILCADMAVHMGELG